MIRVARPHPGRAASVRPPDRPPWGRPSPPVRWARPPAAALPRPRSPAHRATWSVFLDRALSCLCLPFKWHRVLGACCGIEQLLEERPVVHERLALLLCADITVLLRQVNAVCGAVVLDDLWVVYRDVGRPLIEVIDGIAPGAHHLGHQPIGDAD